jgi:hypothetical protein
MFRVVFCSLPILLVEQDMKLKKGRRERKATHHQQKKNIGFIELFLSNFYWVNYKKPP